MVPSPVTLDGTWIKKSDFARGRDQTRSHFIKFSEMFFTLRYTDTVISEIAFKSPTIFIHCWRFCP